MADITLTCSQCGNQITISEHDTAETVKCMKCANRVPVPKREPAQVAAPPPKLKMAQPAEPAPAAAPAPTAGKPVKKLVDRDQRHYLPRSLKRRRRERATTGHLYWPWVIFVVLGVALTVLRYSHILGPDLVDLLRTGGICAVFFIHVSLIAYAFGEDAFQGVLCAIVPGYSLYYLFFQSDQFYFRAILAALLVAFGLDTWVTIRDFTYESYIDIKYWIETTDTLKEGRSGP
jgi:DNA-directed RNA polymerase subunit RPC12/RpoP